MKYTLKIISPQNLKALLHYLPPSSDIVEKFNCTFIPDLRIFFPSLPLRFYNLLFDLCVVKFPWYESFHLSCKYIVGSPNMEVHVLQFWEVFLNYFVVFPLYHHFLFLDMYYLGYYFSHNEPFFCPIFHFLFCWYLGKIISALSPNPSIAFFLPYFPQNYFYCPKKIFFSFVFLLMDAINSLSFRGHQLQF